MCAPWMPYRATSVPKTRARRKRLVVDYSEPGPIKNRFLIINRQFLRLANVETERPKLFLSKKFETATIKDPREDLESDKAAKTAPSQLKLVTCEWRSERAVIVVGQPNAVVRYGNDNLVRMLPIFELDVNYAVRLCLIAKTLFHTVHCVRNRFKDWQQEAVHIPWKVGS
jgi:hypothetical protein